MSKFLHYDNIKYAAANDDRETILFQRQLNNDDHWRARANSEMYTCCVYNIQKADYCLSSDQECIDDYNELQGRFFIVIAVIVVILLLVFGFLMLFCYVKSKRKNLLDEVKKMEKKEDQQKEGELEDKNADQNKGID